MVPTVIALAGLFAVSIALPTIGILPRKIVGGEPAVEGELPYQVSLRNNGRHVCGGSIVVVDGVQTILTAAHCIAGPSNGRTIVAGDVDRTDTTGNEQTRNVTNVIPHEAYFDAIHGNDIAILTIDRPLEFNANVAPIALPKPAQFTQGDVLVSGWGTLQSGGTIPAVLQKVQIPVVSDRRCRQAYGGYIISSMLCAGILGQGGKDSCQRDSGGPLVSVSGNYLAGIVSWGRGCADGRYPGVNTEVAYFIDWINEQVQRLKLTG